jgi:hypothetical protein
MRAPSRQRSPWHKGEEFRSFGFIQRSKTKPDCTARVERRPRRCRPDNGRIGWRSANPAYVRDHRAVEDGPAHRCQLDSGRTQWEQRSEHDDAIGLQTITARPPGNSAAHAAPDRASNMANFKPVRNPIGAAHPERPIDAIFAMVVATRSYIPQPYRGRVLLFKGHRTSPGDFGYLIADGAASSRASLRS